MNNALKVNPVAELLFTETGLWEWSITVKSNYPVGLMEHHNVRRALYDKTALDASFLAGFEACRESLRKALTLKVREYPLCQWEIDALLDAITPPTEQAKAEK